MARDVDVDDVDDEVEEGVVDGGGDDVVVGVLEEGVTYDTTTEALCLTVTVTGTEVNTVVSLCTEGEAWAEEGEGDEVGVGCCVED